MTAISPSIKRITKVYLGMLLLIQLISKSEDVAKGNPNAKTIDVMIKISFFIF